MRYTLWKLDEPFGKPNEIILESNDKAEIVRRVAKLFWENEDPAMFRMTEDKAIPEPEIKPVYDPRYFD